MTRYVPRPTRETCVSIADPPGDCLRIRLVVAILEGCGSYFVRGAGLEKLSKFLAVFQRCGVLSARERSLSLVLAHHTLFAEVAAFFDDCVLTPHKFCGEPLRT